MAPVCCRFAKTSLSTLREHSGAIKQEPAKPMSPSTNPLLTPSPVVLRLAHAVVAAGGRLWIVGGSVRDALLGRESHDHDLEVHHMAAERLQPLLEALGTTRAVGRSFEVYKVWIAEGSGGDGHQPDEVLDVSLPRFGGMQRPVGGRDDLESLRRAARRRDFTINAMAYDPLSNEVADPYGGRDDLRAGRLRCVAADTFVEDPLRGFRAARFMATLDLKPAPSLDKLCSTLDVGGIAPERIGLELQRLMVEGTHVGAAWSWLHTTGLAERTHTELAGLGHAAEALDRAAPLRVHLDNPARVEALMWSVALAAAGPSRASTILDHLRIERRRSYPLARTVLRILSEGPCPIDWTEALLRHAAERVEVGLWTLASFALDPSPQLHEAWLRSHALGVAREKLPSLLRGADLRELGVVPGPGLGALLAAVRTAQLDGVVDDPLEAMALARRLWSSSLAPST